MRFLLDQNQSPLLVGLLAAVGHDAVHVRDVAMATAIDREILSFPLEPHHHDASIGCSSVSSQTRQRGPAGAS